MQKSRNNTLDFSFYQNGLVIEFSMTFDQIDLIKETEQRGEESSGFSITRDGKKLQLTNNELIDAMLVCIQKLSENAVATYTEVSGTPLPPIVRQGIVRDFVNKVVESIPLQVAAMADEVFMENNDTIPDPYDLMKKTH